MSNPNSQLTTNLVPVQAIFDPNGNIVSLVGPGGEYFSPPISSDTIVNSTIDSSPIGLTTPSTGAFTSLLASGNTQLQTLSATATTVNSLTINGTLTAGGSIGTMGQLLQSTGTGVQWITASIYGVNITDDTTSATVHYPTLVTNTTGTTTQEYTSSTKLQFTPSTGTLFSTIGSFTNLSVASSVTLTNYTGYVYANGAGAITASTTIPNTSITGLGTMSTQNANNVAITGGSISGVSLTLYSLNSTPVGNITPSTGAFTTLSTTGLASLNSLSTANATITGGSISGVSLTLDSINNTPIGNTTPSTGAFTEVLSPIVGANTGSSLSLWSNGVTNATLDTNGNLGLGVIPSAWSVIGPVIQFTDGGFVGSQGIDGTFYIGQNHYYNGTNFIYTTNGYATQYQSGLGAGNHAWFIAPSGTAGNPITFTQAMTLTNSGYLGIGTTSPSTPLHVNVANTSADSVISFGNNNGGGQLSVSATGIPIITNYSAGPIAFGYQSTPGSIGTFVESMRIDSLGNLLVGQTTAGIVNSNSCQLGILGNLIANHANGTSSGTLYATFGYNGTGIGSISQYGTTSVLYNTTSDQRLKTDLGVASQSRIQDVVIHDYEWKSDGSKSRGVFAQELHNVIPEAVSIGNDEVDENGNLKKPWAVDYSKLVPDLIVEIQALRKEIELLKGVK